MDTFSPSLGRLTDIDARWLSSWREGALSKPRAPAASIGESLGGCRLEREIHRGAKSTVYAARDLDSGRAVAIKVLATGSSREPGSIGRFCREAEIARRVRHPAIVPVLAIGKDRDRPYYVMKLESGETLADLAANRPVHRDESHYVDLARRLVPVCDAVALLHRQGIVHRDVQPSNLLVDREGLLVLVDFGASLERGVDVARAQEGHSAGDLYHLSPEQLSPHADLFDPAADVYALGLTLWGLVTGRRAFPDDDIETLARWKLTRRPPSARHVNSFVPPGLDAIIRQAIEPNRVLRYEDAGALARDLRRFVSRKLGDSRRRGLSRN